MALTLGSTGMDAATETQLRNAFEQANAATGQRWTWQGGDRADYVVVDMDSLYGPMSWLQLHAAGRRVIGLTSNSRSQTDYRLPHPLDSEALAVLLSEIAGNHQDSAGPEPTQGAQPAMPSGASPAPAPADILPPPPALAVDEEQQPMPVPGDTPVAQPEPPLPVEAPASIDTHVVAAEVAPAAPRQRRLADWLRPGALNHRVRLEADGQVLLVDPGARRYHAGPALKPLGAFFEPVLEAADLPPADDAQWQADAARLGEGQPLARLQWLGGLASGGGQLLPGNDPDGQYRLVKWPQTEREYPKHFRIATAMMKGPATIAEIAQTAAVERAEVADFVNANLATGYAEFVPPPPPEPEEPAAKPPGGLFGRLRGR